MDAVEDSKESGAGKSGRAGATHLLLWYLLYPAAFFIRLENLQNVLGSSGIFPISTDSYYHLRRIQETVERFPKVPDFDHYVNFPTGSVVSWSFGFDFLFAAIVKLTYVLSGGKGQPDSGWIWAVCVILPPLFGALIPCVVFWIARTCFDARAGFLAGTLALILLPLQQTSCVGYVDHHFFEALCFSFYFWGLAKGIRGSTVWPLLSGLALATGFVCATIVPILLPVHGLFLAAVFLSFRKENNGRDLVFRLGALPMLGCFPLLSPFVIFRFAEPHGINPSLTTAWLGTFALWVLAAGLAYLCQPDSSQGPPARQKPFLMAGVLFGCATIPWLSFVAIGRFLVYAFEHARAGDPWLASIIESQPLHSLGFSGISTLFTFLIWFFPIVFAWIAYRAFRKDKNAILVASMAAGTVVFTLLQIKFGGPFAVLWAILCGSALSWLFEKIPGVPEKFRSGLKVAFATGFVAAFYPTLFYLTTVPPFLVSRTGTFENIYPVLNWIRDNTPATSSEGTRESDYAILSEWNYGHWIINWAGRPTVASPLGHTPPLRSGIRDAARIFVSPPETAFPDIRAHRVRFVLVTPLVPEFVVRDALWPDPLASKRAAGPEGNEILKTSLYKSLVSTDAVPEGVPALRHFRLVFESRNSVPYPLFTLPHAFGKLFEIVPGAVLTGNIKPFAEVGMKTRIRTPQGREFDYSDRVKADDQGNFEIRVPYPNSPPGSSRVIATVPYELHSDDWTGVATASEGDIQAGRKLNVQRIK